MTLDEEERKMLYTARDAAIVIAIEKITRTKKNSFWKSLVSGKKISIDTVEPDLTNSKEMAAINKLFEGGLLSKHDEDKNSYVVRNSNGNKIEVALHKTTYSITEAGINKIGELLLAMKGNKVVSIKEFKNNSCPF